MLTATAQAAAVSLGGDLHGYYVRPAGRGPFPAVLLYQEAFGVNDYIRSEVDRLAAAGYAALAPDLFRGETYGYDDMPRVYARLQSLTPEGLRSDVSASLAFLDRQADLRRDRIGVVGFCMGGRLAVRTAIDHGRRIAAAVSFYGGGIAPSKPRVFPPLVHELARVDAELLLIYGADDEGIGPDEHARVAGTLSRLKKAYMLSVYPGAPHGFASRDRPSYRPQQAEAAWQQTLALFDRTLRSGGASC